MIKMVAMTMPHLAYFIYADRRVVHRGRPSFTRPERGVYFAEKEETPRKLQDEVPFLCDDAVVILPSPALGYDVYLEDPETYVQEISQARGIRAAKNLIRPMKMLTEEEFSHFVAMSCVLRRWYREAFISREKVYNLFEALMKSKKDFLTVYFSIRGSMSAPELFSSILTFLTRISLYEDQRETLSVFYRRLVQRGKSQSMNLMMASKRILRSPNEVPLDAKVIQFCFDLRG